MSSSKGTDHYDFWPRLFRTMVWLAGVITATLLPAVIFLTLLAIAIR